MMFFNDFGMQNGAQQHSKINKNPFPNPSRNQTPKKTKIFCSRTLQTLKIELACRRGAIFHKTAVFEKLQKLSKFMSKQLPESLKFSKKVIQKSNQKTTRKTAWFCSKKGAEMEPKGDTWRGYVQAFSTPGPPKGPPRHQTRRKTFLRHTMTQKSDQQTQKYQKSGSPRTYFS